ncbi:MAG: protein-disulfide reductase DsbD [Zoogloeaceae bacterium]|jgi:thiol:disulfide interchange protein DsbD|nr:protein-disulfide reductase DsbD [Zoogloeaceae bacterium]
MRLKGLLILVWLLGLIAPAWADDFLDPALAFKPSVRALDANTLEVRFAIAPGYYLYRERFRFKSESPPLLPPRIPPGKEKMDDAFGLVEVFYDSVAIVLPVERNASGRIRFPLEVTSQGCAESGLCYLPQTQVLEAELPAETEVLPLLGADDADGMLDESGFFARMLLNAGFWGKLLIAFVAGLGLSLTPCVFPMLPILSGIIAGQKETPGKLRAFLLSLTYVLGMALVYAAAGVAAGFSGVLLSSLLQNVWALSIFALIFVALALAMFDVYTLQMPAGLQGFLARHSRRFKGGHFFAVFLMGAISALIVGPCVAAPLAGALLYIGQTGDAILGGAALFVMALGMGMPLLALGLSAGILLPKAGAWMGGVKKGFGFLLLATAVWIVSPVVPATAVLAAYGVILLGAAIFLRAFEALPTQAKGGAYLRKLFAFLLLLWGVALFIGALSGGDNPLQPLARLNLTQNAGVAKADNLPFERVRTLAELEARLLETAAAGRAVMLDFYADWCVACKEMERFTFSDAAVRTRLAPFVLLQVDVTESSEADRELLRRFQLFGPPGILFFDANGREMAGIRVVGFQNAERFLKTLDQAVR